MTAACVNVPESATDLFRNLAVDLVQDHFGKAQDPVQRGAQLVGHIRQELRLVAAGRFELLVLLLDFLE